MSIEKSRRPFIGYNRSPWPSPSSHLQPADCLLEVEAETIPYVPGVTTHRLEVARRLCRFARRAVADPSPLGTESETAFQDVLRLHCVHEFKLTKTNMRQMIVDSARGYTADLHRALGIDVDKAREWIVLLNRLGDLRDEQHRVTRMLAAAEDLPGEMADLCEHLDQSAIHIRAQLDGYSEALGTSAPKRTRGGVLGGRGRADLLRERRVLDAKAAHGTRGGARDLGMSLDAFKREIRDINKRRK